MKRLNINFIFLILAVISLLFLEGGLLFRVFGDYLGENLISSLIGVICMQCGFFAISLNSDTNEYKIPPQWLFVIFGQTLLVCYNIYHVIELLPKLKSNGLPQYIIGIATGLFIPFLGGLLLDLLAAKMKKIEGFKVWKDTLYQIAVEESKHILSEFNSFKIQVNELQQEVNKRDIKILDLQQEVNKRDIKILDLQQAVNAEKKRAADLAGGKSGKEIIIGELQKSIEILKAQHANELLRITQEKGKDTGELGEMRAKNEMNAKEIARLNLVIETKQKAFEGLNKMYEDARGRAKLLEGVNDSFKTLQLEMSAKDFKLNELRERLKANMLYEKVIVPWNRGMKIGKTETTKAGETRYSLIEKELGADFLPIVYSLERMKND